MNVYLVGPICDEYVVAGTMGVNWGKYLWRVIAEGSVHRALRVKYYKRGLRCLRLMYEAFMS